MRNLEGRYRESKRQKEWNMANGKVSKGPWIIWKRLNPSTTIAARLSFHKTPKTQSKQRSKPCEPQKQTPKAVLSGGSEDPSTQQQNEKHTTAGRPNTTGTNHQQTNVVFTESQCQWSVSFSRHRAAPEHRFRSARWDVSRRLAGWRIQKK